ncbi:MAG TPA: hypothetical protein VMR89_09810 [Actinomycetota bacterium]|nr:hypothetical protein [Actinomycetota bacterium]
MASFSVLRSSFREEPDRPLGQTPSQADTSRLDPEEICDIPTYDPSVALLGDDSSSVFGATASREVPLELLEAPGAPASSIAGPATDALRSFLVDPQAVHAPSDGWRAIVDTPDEVIFAAPPDGGSDWWITRFTLADGAWTARESELVDQHQTAAQLGRDLSLMWGETTVVDDGVWGSTLHLNNDRRASWSSGEGGYELWGVAHVFDPETGGEVGHAARSVGGWGVESVLPPDEAVRLPLSLGGALLALRSGHEYDVVACVPELGLASPVGMLRVAEHPMASARVLTYPFEGTSMLALGGGRLVIHDGCLAVAGRSPRPIYVLWPDGYSLVYRQQEEPVLIDPVGREVARLGDEVSLGGGYVPRAYADEATIGGLPDACRTGGEGYFMTGGLAPG